MLGNSGNGIRAPRSSSVLIEGNFIGTNAAGTAAIPNVWGVSILGDSGPGGLLIGGTSPGAGNLISGNSDRGIDCGYATGLTIQGNKIGTDVTGTVAIPNGTGIDDVGGDLIGGTAPGAGNLISGNTNAGIGAADYSGPSTIQGNYIGTNASGTMALGNNVGVTGSDLTIGGTIAAARNVIAGNTTDIYCDNSLVEGNYIGTDKDGEVALSYASGEADIFNSTNLTVVNNVIASQNGGVAYLINGCVFKGNMININKEGTHSLSTSGLAIYPLGGNNTFGGTAPGQGNLICGDIVLATPASSGNVIQGNKIGTDINGTTQLYPGVIALVDGAANNLIGGTTNGAGNLLEAIQDYYTTQNASNTAGGNAFLGNSFYPGTPPYAVSKSIILSESYYTYDVGAVNDPGDADTGPNGAQNYPVLTAAGAGAHQHRCGQFEQHGGRHLPHRVLCESGRRPAGPGDRRAFTSGSQPSRRTPTATHPSM